MSISYKKITSMINRVIENDTRFNEFDSDALRDLCVDIYTLESSLDSGQSTSAVKEAIKGKVSIRYSKVLKESE